MVGIPFLARRARAIGWTFGVCGWPPDVPRIGPGYSEIHADLMQDAMIIGAGRLDTGAFHDLVEWLDARLADAIAEGERDMQRRLDGPAPPPDPAEAASARQAVARANAAHAAHDKAALTYMSGAAHG